MITFFFFSSFWCLPLGFLFLSSDDYEQGPLESRFSNLELWIDTLDLEDIIMLVSDVRSWGFQLFQSSKI